MIPINKAPLSLLLIFLAITINCNFEQPLYKCQHKDERNPLPNVVSKLSTKQKEEQRRRIEVETDSDGFRDLNIYLDLENIKKDIDENGLEDYKEELLSSIEKAVQTLESLLKVKPLQKPYALSNKNFEELGIQAWNTEIFGDEANEKEGNNFQALGIDLAIFGRILDLGDSTLATANAMAFQDSETNKGQPYAGIVRINKNINFTVLNTQEFFQVVLVHEFTHILGFSKAFFMDYYHNIFSKKDSYGIQRTYLNSPKLLEVARKYFDCSTLEGVELENQGGEGTEGSHWEARILLGEYMTGYSYTEEQVISEFTLAVLEDSGYYKPNYYTGGLMRFGKHKGCAFLNEKCVNPQTHKTNENFENEFFDSIIQDIEAGCSSGRQSRAYKFFYLFEDLPDIYSYFEESTKATYFPADYCPVSMIYPLEENIAHYSGHCSEIGQKFYGGELNYKEKHFDGTSEALVGSTGEELSDHSFCFLSSLYKHVDSYPSSVYDVVRANCYEIFCSERSLTVKIFEDYIVCPRAGGKVKVLGYEGYLLCPDYNLICSGTVICNNIFDCVEKKSEIKDKDYLYDYVIKTSQNIEKSKTEIYKTDNYELSEDGQCSQNCKHCRDRNICLECRDNYGLLAEESGEINCFSNEYLSRGYFKNEETNIFEKCLDNCVSCTERESCKECSSGYVYSQGQCKVLSNPDKSIANCFEYDAEENCKKCKSNYGFKEDKKDECLNVETDFANYYTEDGESYYPCSNINSNCSKCYFDHDKNNVICTLCINDFVLLNKEEGICFPKEEIGEGYYLINDTHIGVCSEVINKCIACENENFCSQCPEGLSFVPANKNKNGKNECIVVTYELGTSDGGNDKGDIDVDFNFGDDNDNSSYFSLLYIFWLQLIFISFYL